MKTRWIRWRQRGDWCSVVLCAMQLPIVYRGKMEGDRWMWCGWLGADGGGGEREARELPSMSYGCGGAWKRGMLVPRRVIRCGKWLAIECFSSVFLKLHYCCCSFVYDVVVFSDYWWEENIWYSYCLLFFSADFWLMERLELISSRRRWLYVVNGT